MLLSELTGHYWKISMAYNRRPEGSDIRVQGALRFLSLYTQPIVGMHYKRVHIQMMLLQDNIIQGRPSRNRKEVK